MRRRTRAPTTASPLRRAFWPGSLKIHGHTSSHSHGSPVLSGPPPPHSQVRPPHRTGRGALFRSAEARVAIVTELDYPDLRRGAREAGAEVFISKADLLVVRDLIA